MGAISKKVSELTVNAIGNREPIQIVYECWGLEVRQKVTEAVKLVYNTSDVVTGGIAEEHYAGTPAFYYPRRDGKRTYGVGQIIGYIETVSSSAVFQLIHYLEN